jgi:hypothetical protein
VAETQAYKNLFRDTTGASVPAGTVLRGSFRKHVFSYIVIPPSIACFVSNSPEVIFRIPVIYKEPSIIFGTRTAMWSELTLGLPATIALEIVPFRAYAPLPALLPFFKCILEVMFCEDVQDRMRFCLDHLSCVKMAAF